MLKINLTCLSKNLQMSIDFVENNEIGNIVGKIVNLSKSNPEI